MPSHKKLGRKAAIDDLGLLGILEVASTVQDVPMSLIELIKDRAAKPEHRTDMSAHGGGFSSKTLDDSAIARAELQLEFQLPPILREVYQQIGNGGFGPGYADSHRGLCLHFRSRPGAFGLARKVRYRNMRAPLRIPLQRQSNDAIMDRLVFNKAKFWSYESEYRIIASESGKADPILKSGYMYFDSLLLVGITFGLRMPKKDRISLVAHARRHNPNIAFWEVIEDHSNFALIAQRYSGAPANASQSLARAIAATAASRIGRR